MEAHPTRRQIDEMEAGLSLDDWPPEDPTDQIRDSLLAIGGGVLVNWPIVRRIARERRGVPGLISMGPAPRLVE